MFVVILFYIFYDAFLASIPQAAAIPPQGSQKIINN